MNTLTGYLGFAALFVFSGMTLSAQDINIRRVEIENDKVYLYYDLADTAKGRFYTVNLYSSRDNFINPLQRLKGDVGIEVVPGSARKIEINALEEFGAAFTGKVAFELRAKVFIPFIRMEGFVGKKFKRGKPYEIHWTGGRPQNVLNFDLYRGEEKISTFPNIPNAGKYNLVFPTDTKTGSNYHFRVSDSKNRDEVINTSKFSVRRKIPLLYLILPAPVIGVAIFLAQPPEGEPDIDDFPLISKQN